MGSLERIQNLEADKLALEEQAAFLKGHLERCENEATAARVRCTAEATLLKGELEKLLAQIQQLESALRENQVTSVKFVEEKAVLTARINLLEEEVLILYLGINRLRCLAFMNLALSASM